MIRNRVAALIGAAICAGCAGAANAELLGVAPTNPLVFYNSGGTTTYDADTDLFSISATPLAVQFVLGDPPTPIMPTVAGDRDVVLDIFVDSAGAFVSGLAGDDFIMTGAIDEDGDTVIDYEGVLLAGEVVAFGFLEAGATDLFDFRVIPTGGALMPLIGADDIGIELTVEGSTFGNDFTVDFDGGAKGNIGPIDPITGACCFIDSAGAVSCAELTEEECRANTGLFFGVGFPCLDVTCGGACCLTDGTCIHVLTEDDCVANGGEFFGNGSNCSDIECREPGACCLPGTQECEILSADACDLLGGDYQGDATECNEDTCRDPGACCVHGVCCVVSERECEHLGGDYKGDGSECRPNTCRETGACCYTYCGERRCRVLTEYQCACRRGEYKGDGTECEPDTCRQTGACCYTYCGRKRCRTMTEHECVRRHGSYQGDGSECLDSDNDGKYDCFDPCPHDPCDRCVNNCRRRCGDDDCNGNCRDDRRRRNRNARDRYGRRGRGGWGHWGRSGRRGW